MRLLVCGGRDFHDRDAAFTALDKVHKLRTVSIVIHGDADGADRIGKWWAVARCLHHAAVPALWDVYDKAAGPKRNRAMLLLQPEGVVAFPGGRGTADMVRAAREAGITVWQPLG